MFSCKDIDALMMGWLYDELDASQAALFEQHTRSCAHCRSETESLQQARRQARARFGGLDELEPPAAISAKLMHEAARRVPVAPQRAHAGQSDEEAAPWGWFFGLMRPLAAHPGLAAAASFVLLVGVAGSLYWTGKHRFAEPTLADRVAATSPTAAESPAQGQAWPAADDVAPEPAAEGASEAGDPADSELHRDEEIARAGYPADLADDKTARDLGIAIDQIEPDRKALPLTNLGNPGKPKASPARSDKSKNEAFAAARGSNSVPDNIAASAVTGANRRIGGQRMGEDEPGADSASAADSDDNTGLMAGIEAPAGNRLTGMASGSTTPARQQAAPAPTLPSSSSEISGSTRFASPPPARPASPMTESADPIVQSAPASTRSPASTSNTEASRLAAAQARERSLRSALGVKRCTEAARIAVDLLDTNPGYYSRNIAGLPELGACQPEIAAERSRRARVRASKAGKAPDTTDTADAADVRPGEPAAPSAK